MPELKNRVKIYKAERKISIDRSEARDAGNYSCGVRDDTKDFEVIGEFFLPFMIDHTTLLYS